MSAVSDDPLKPAPAEPDPALPAEAAPVGAVASTSHDDRLHSLRGGLTEAPGRHSDAGAWNESGCGDIASLRRCASGCAPDPRRSAVS